MSVILSPNVSKLTYNEKFTIIPTANLVITVNIQYFFKKKELTKNRIIPHRYHIWGNGFPWNKGIKYASNTQTNKATF